MAHKRKRANSSKKNESKPTKKEEPKGKQYVKPLDNIEVQYFNELGAVSSNYAKAAQDYATYQYAVKKLELARKNVQDGKIIAPFTITVIPKVMWGTLKTKKDALDYIDDHLKIYQKAIKSIRGQLESRYDQYLETASRTKEFVGKKYSGDIKPHHIVPDRGTGRKEEDAIFKAEFEKLLENSPEGEKTRKEFKAAKKEAVKRNTKKKTTKKE